MLHMTFDRPCLYIKPYILFLEPIAVLRCICCGVPTESLSEMAHTQRIETLSRHLTTATGLDVVSTTEDLLDNTAELGHFSPRDLYEYTVRDNIELRDEMLEFLKVRDQDSCNSIRADFICDFAAIDIYTIDLSAYTALQDPVYKPNHYLSLMEFRQQTLERLQKFVAQRYFITKDYIDSKACQHVSNHCRQQLTT